MTISDESNGWLEKAVVKVMPLGHVDEVVLSIIAANVQTLLGLTTDIHAPEPLYDYAYLPNRRQYDAGPILKELAESTESGQMSLGITSEDLCLPILTHVFGEAQMGGRAAVISYHRLKAGPLGESGGNILYERTVKVALHETAHMLGMPHCREDNCLMRFSQDPKQLDALNVTFCSNCTKELIRLRKPYLAQPENIQQKTIKAASGI